MELDLFLQVKDAKNKLGTLIADKLHLTYKGENYTISESEKGLQLKKVKNVK